MTEKSPVVETATAVATVSIPFASAHAAMGVMGALAARHQHTDSTSTVTVQMRRRNIVVFAGTCEDLIAYVDRLNSRGLLSRFVHDSAVADLRQQCAASSP